jgi:hypothetical protein
MCSDMVEYESIPNLGIVGDGNGRCSVCDWQYISWPERCVVPVDEPSLGVGATNLLGPRFLRGWVGKGSQIDELTILVPGDDRCRGRRHGRVFRGVAWQSSNCAADGSEGCQDDIPTCLSPAHRLLRCSLPRAEALFHNDLKIQKIQGNFSEATVVINRHFITSNSR